MGGFGPPWVLFAILSALGLYYDWPNLAEAVRTDAYILSSIIVSFGIAAGRTAIAVKIAWDREAYLAANPGARASDISHTHYWWCHWAGFALSCVLVLGDGMGRIWAVVSAVDVFCTLYTGFVEPLSELWYITVSLVVAAAFGVARLCWWAWYWLTFANVADDDVLRSDDRLAKGGDVDANAGCAELARSVYPLLAYALSPRARTALKHGWHFLDGFGRVFAVFASVNVAVDFADGQGPLFMTEPYFWTTIVFALAGGLYAVLGRPTKRFKVFLHEENELRKRRGLASRASTPLLV